MDRSEPAKPHQLRNAPASFLSVFTGIVLKAAHTWRVSISSTARPAFAVAA